MFKLIRKIEDQFIDARAVGLGFVARHLKLFARLHRFSYRGKSVTIRLGTTDARTLRHMLSARDYEMNPHAEKRVRERYDAILESGKMPVIVDAGGHAGMAAIWFANRYSKARVVTIEPDRGNFDILQQNARQWPNIIPICAAVGGKPGGAVSLSGDEEWGYQTTRTEGGDTPVVTIPEAKARVPDGELLIVKINIEGFEDEVFDGDTSWLDETQCMMIEPHDWLRPDDKTSRSFQREMGKRDFNLYIRNVNLIYVR